MSDLRIWLEGRNILLVEDDALIAVGLISYLEELGATVTWVANVSKAIGWIERAKVDLAIVDFNLDGEMSSPVLDQLIARDVFTILCTGYDQNSIDERFRNLPRSDKPFTRAKIRSLIANKF